MTLDLQRPLPATAADLAEEEYLKPSAMVDSSDEVVVELAHSVDDALAREGVVLPRRAGAKPRRGAKEPSGRDMLALV